MRKKWAWLYWIFPIAVVSSSFFVLGPDAPDFIRWWLVFFLLGLVFLPLASRIFKDTRDAGYLFSKPLALALASFTMWTLSYLHILPFRLISILLVTGAFAVGLLLSKKNRRSVLAAIKTPHSIRLMAVEETIFAASLLFWSFARGLKPVLDSLEKPMDYGFMMSMMRTDYLPALDMWYAQGNINYYYYGQYLYTFLTKLAGLWPDVTYNLSIAAAFALTFSLAFALCYMLLSFAMKKGAGLFRMAPAIGGAIGAFFTAMGGNSHSFFYGTDNPGNVVLRYLQSKGWLDRLLSVPSDAVSESGALGVNIADFWFANSTRFIGYNPETHDKTIHEFPFYSFLVADLHAHLINLAFVFLFIALLAVLLHSSKITDAARAFRRIETGLIRDYEEHWLKKEFLAGAALLKATLSQPVFLLCGLLLGIFMMCNFWDFAIYIVVVSMVLLVANLRGYGKLGTWETIPVFLFQVILILVPFLFLSSPYLALLGFATSALLCFGLLLLVGDSFTVTGAQLSLLFFLSHLVTLPFNANFDPMAKSMALCLNHTPVFQLLVLWGTHLFTGALFVVYILRRRSVEKNDMDAAAVYGRGRISRFLAGMNPIDLFACGLFVCGLIFILLPEVVYVVDIYSGDYKRANTMFKFTYQAFVMLSLVIGYAVVRIALTKHKKRSKVDLRWTLVSVMMAVSLAVPAYYPIVATKQWLGDFKKENYIGLNGISGLPDADRMQAILWINENIKGQPVLLESFGDSYTEHNQLSAYTGLPTIMGWQTHEWLWRTSKEVTDGYNLIVKPRQLDVQTIYEFSDDATARSLLEKYEVAYIVVGALERIQFPEINESKLQSLGRIVYSNASLYIIRITLPYDYSTVTFTDWDGDVLDVQQVNQDGAATAPSDPARTGYSFTGWDVPYGTVGSDLTVTAQYIINTYTVIFKDWNGEILDTQRIDYGGAASPPDAPPRTGYTFSGWDADFGFISRDLVLTTEYAINHYKVVFKDWNGRTLATQTVVYEGSATAPAAPVREGYIFKGWSAGFDRITSDLAIKAVYEINHYTVMFKDWDGEVLETQIVDYGGAATAPTDPARTGYTFSGWDVPFDPVKNNLTATAIYTIID